MTSLSDLARKAGLQPVSVRHDTYLATLRDIERLLALHVQELCAGVEPVYQLRFKDSANWCDCSPNQYEVTSQDSQNYETRILYPATTVAALRARVAELEKDAERYQWLRNQTGGARDIRSKCKFILPEPHPIGDIMKGSVAQHLDAAIDEALRSKK